MAVPKAKARPLRCADTTVGQDEDDISTGSSASSSASDDTGNAPTLFSLGGWFGQSSAQRSRASRSKNSVDESSQDEDGTMDDFSTVDNASVDSSVSGGETHLGTAAQSVIISLSYSGPDSERSDEESASRSRRGSIQYRGGSSARGWHQKAYKEAEFQGRNVMRVTTKIAAESLGLQDESRDPGDVRNSATETASRDDGSYSIVNTPKRGAQRYKLASNFLGSPRPPTSHRAITSDAPTVCGETVISTPSKARAFLEQDDASASRLPVENLSTPTTKNSWLGFGWFASPTNDPSRDEEGDASATIEPLSPVEVPKSEESTTPEVTRHVKVEERKPSRVGGGSGCSVTDEIEVSTLGPLLSESPIDKSMIPKVRLGNFRDLFSSKKGKAMVGQSTREKEDHGCENVEDDPEQILVRLTEATEGSQEEVDNRLVSTNDVPSVGAPGQDQSPAIPAPIKAAKSEEGAKSSSRGQTATPSTKPEKKAMIPLSLPRPRKIGTKPSPANVATKESKSPAEPENLGETSANIPASLPKADASPKSATSKLSMSRRKKFARWYKDSTRKIGKTPSSSLRTGSDLPTIDEEAKESSSRMGVFNTQKEMTLNENFTPAQQTILLDTAAAGETHQMTTNGTIPVHASNSSISFQSGRSSASKMSKASKMSITSGHSEETIKRKNRGILRRLLKNKPRQDTTPDHGELSDLITQYKEMKNMVGPDGPRTVGFFLEKKNKLVFSSLAEERRALRAMNLAVAQRLQEIDEMQQKDIGNDLCGASLCLCG